MGIRWLEKRLAAEMCFEAVESAVEEYLRDSRKVGKPLPVFRYLERRMAETGFHPPGLFNAVVLVERGTKRAHEDAERADKRPIEPILPNADYLIEGIMAPYPFRELRAYWSRMHRQLRVHRMAEERERMRQDAT